MKKTIIPAILLLMLAAVIAVGGQTFLAPCVHEDGSFGPCHWAGQALTGLGCVLAAAALLILFVKRAGFGLFLGTIPVCLMGILTPGTLISLCGMSTMRCRMVTRPAMMILFSAAMICAAIGAALSAGRDRKA